MPARRQTEGPLSRRDRAIARAAGMRHFLNAFPDLMLVGEAGSGEEALALCSDTRPHVILMDLVMPGMDGIEATRMIKQHYPQVQIIALTSFQEGDLVERFA